MSRSIETDETQACTRTTELAMDDERARDEKGAPQVSAIDAPISKASMPLFVDYLRSGAKPQTEWLSGLEFELFGYTAREFERLDAAQVQATLARIAASSDELHFENGILMEALTNCEARVTVEPGGQVEFSGAPRKSLSECERDMRAYLARLHSIAEESGFAFLASGFDPLRTIDEQRWYPKARYAVMRPYMAARGRRAWDMMTRTCAIQVSLDYESETDLAKKFILGNRLAPIITAIFANSPFENGEPSGYKSTRAAVWLETDSERDVSLEAFVEYAFNVPMIFTRRSEIYAPVAAGLSFGTFLDGADTELLPVFQDWTDHLTTIFTEARLKQYVELRSADCGPVTMALALQALWKGLMYDADALDEALRLAPNLAHDEMRALQEEVAREALAARYAGVDVLSLAKETLALAALGLGRVAPEEVRYLDVLREQVIEDEVCPADIQLRNWHGSWHGSLIHLIEHLRIA
jgi:glutamate--cysteine ligase